MPRKDGIAAAWDILAEDTACRTKVLMLTTFDLDEHVYDALAAGASGFLLKDVTLPELLNAVRVAADGGALLAPSATSRLIAEFARQRRVVVPPAYLSGLTERDRAQAVILAYETGLVVPRRQG